VPWFIVAPITGKHHRSDSPPAMLRGSKLSGAGTLWLALIPWFDSTPSQDLIRNKSSDLKIICEFLLWWHHLSPGQTVWLVSAHVAYDVSPAPSVSHPG
jgi:hypothetical protein